MTHPHRLLAPAAALLPASGHIVRESPPLHRASAATLLADGTDQREAQELPEMHRFPSHREGHTMSEARTGHAAGQGAQEGENGQVAWTDTGSSSVMRGNGLWARMRRVWARHVSLRVPAESRRDHLALERTYLGYIRTSVTLSTTGVTLAQLFRLTGSMDDDQPPVRGGSELAACFIIAAILVVLLGAVRYWRQQTAMARGKVWAGGFEVLVIMALVVLLCIVAFAVVVATEKQL